MLTGQEQSRDRSPTHIAPVQCPNTGWLTK